MSYDATATVNESTFQMIPPLFQPLRLWTPRPQAQGRGMDREMRKKAVRMPLHAFTIRGGFVNMAGGERRLVIAGRIFRRREG